MFEHRCLLITGLIWWWGDNFVSTLKVGHEVLGPVVQSLEQALNQNKLRLLVHVLRMPTERLPHCMLCFEAGDR